MSILLLPLFTLLVSVATARSSSSSSSFFCRDDSDCSYNGFCNVSAARGSCFCRPAWTGEDCGVLNLLPAPVDSGLRLKGHRGFSNGWGGSPIRQVRKESNSTSIYYALIAAAFENNCSLSDWQTNSVIVRAISTTGPLGPFNETNFDVVVRAFAHNPEATPIGTEDGGFALFFIGKNESRGSQAKNCFTQRGTTQYYLEAPQRRQLLKELPGIVCDFGPPMCIRRAFSPGGGREWTEIPGVALEGNPFGWDKDVTNPGPRQGYNFSSRSSQQLPTPSSFFMAYRSTELLKGEQLGMTTAPMWNTSAFTRTAGSSTRSILPTQFGEDPVIWQDNSGHWHMLMHQFRENGPECSAVGGGNSPYGLHAFSMDGLSQWRVSRESAYNCLIDQENTGSGFISETLGVHRRERPKVLLSSDNYGDPVVLYTGVQLSSGYSFTHAQPVATSHNTTTSLLGEL